MGGQPRVVVLSRRAVEQHVWQAYQYEFEDVIAEVDDVALLTPPAAATGELVRLGRGALNRARRAVGLSRRGAMRPVRDAVDADLFFAVFAAPHEIGDLAAVRPQLARSRRKVAYLIEMWSTQVKRQSDYLRRLRGFDHVFVFNRHVAAAVERISGVPTTYLPHATDTELFAPPVPGPFRHSDVTSYGRRAARETHLALVEAMRAGRLCYTYDTIRGPFQVTDHREHRLALANLLQRSRYALVHKINDTTSKLGLTAGEEMLTTRYFEVVAAGAVMLGTAPDLQDYRDAFDWPDALITIPVPAPHIADIIAELDGDPERLARARRANITHALRRHDWAHRWMQVLQVAGLEPLPALGERVQRLHRRAAAHEQAVVTP